MMEYPINRFYRDAKIMEIGGGTTEIRRIIIARELLRDDLQNICSITDY